MPVHKVDARWGACHFMLGAAWHILGSWCGAAGTRHMATTHPKVSQTCERRDQGFWEQQKMSLVESAALGCWS